MQCHRSGWPIAVAAIALLGIASAPAWMKANPVLSDTGRFEPKAVAVLSRSFVQMNLLPTEPDMSKLYTEKFLPKRS